MSPEQTFKRWQEKYPDHFPKNRSLNSYVNFEETGVTCAGDNCVGIGWEQGPMNTIIESPSVKYNDVLWTTSRLCPVLLCLFGKNGVMNAQMITRAKITDEGTNGVSPGGPPTKLVPNNPENTFGCYYLTDKFVFQT